jgi:hypothetical protein
MMIVSGQVLGSTLTAQRQIQDISYGKEKWLKEVSLEETGAV